MYRFYDEKDKVREIQKYLFLPESGNYDERTRDAVIKIQARNDKEQNGKIDYDTFTIIYLEYLKEKQRQKLNARFPDSDFPIKINSYGDAVMEVNKMLILLSDFYGIQTNLKYSDYYGQRSERVLIELSDIYDIERRPGELDGNTYKTLEKDFLAITARGD